MPVVLVKKTPPAMTRPLFGQEDVAVACWTRYEKTKGELRSLMSVVPGTEVLFPGVSPVIHVSEAMCFSEFPTSKRGAFLSGRRCASGSFSLTYQPFFGLLFRITDCSVSKAQKDDVASGTPKTATFSLRQLPLQRKYHRAGRGSGLGEGEREWRCASLGGRSRPPGNARRQRTK